MPTGPVIDSLSTLAGALIGAFAGTKFPERFRNALPQTFGIISMAMGVVMIAKVDQLPPIVLAMLLGSAIGELLKIEQRIEVVAIRVNAAIRRLVHGSKPQHETAFLKDFISVLVLFSASGTGLFGAMNEGITGDQSVLISKAFLDFFTAAIFAASMGLIVATTVIPQIIILLGLYYLGAFVMPHTTPALIADFSACGGIIMLATGFRICGIRNFAIANMLPALIIVMFLSHYWRVLF
jgi:uncharacterized protein